MRFYEEVNIGDKATIGSHTFTVEDIKAFAAQFDPQPFHFDEMAASRSHFGGLCASGWHTACLWMRFVVEYRQREDAELRARGESPATLGVSPGFRDLKWLKPVYAGDTITYATEVIGKRSSATRPQWGILTAHNTGENQRGEPVLSFVSSVFVERRTKRDPSS